MTHHTERCGCKLCKSIELYGLADLNEELRRRRHDDDASLRDLEEFVNKRVLEAALRDTGPLPFMDVDYVYRVLTEDEGSAGKRVEVRNNIEQAGVDVEQLEKQFVTYQTVRKHLQESLEIDTGEKSETSLDESRSRIQRLLSRCEAVITQTINQLRRSDRLSINDFDVYLSATVSCQECGETYQISELFDEESCGCAESLGPRAEPE